MSIKLSETQDAAIREVADLGYTVAKANTIKSLENRGLINPTNLTHHELTDAGREYLGLPALGAPEDSIMEDNSGYDFHTKLMKDVAELESVLQSNPWKIGEQITADEPYLEFPALTTPEEVKKVAASQGIVLTDQEALKVSQEELGDEAPFADGVERYQKAWTSAEKIEAGFGETLNWDNTKVWDGLTAEEIREDMDTRVPANRADRRTHDKAYRKAIKQLVGAL